MTTETTSTIKWLSKPIDLPDYMWIELDRIVKENYMTGRGKALYSRVKHIKGFEEPILSKPIEKQSLDTTKLLSTPKPAGRSLTREEYENQ